MSTFDIEIPVTPSTSQFYKIYEEAKKNEEIIFICRDDDPYGSDHAMMINPRFLPIDASAIITPYLWNAKIKRIGRMRRAYFLWIDWKG